MTKPLGNARPKPRSALTQPRSVWIVWSEITDKLKGLIAVVDNWPRQKPNGSQ